MCAEAVGVLLFPNLLVCLSLMQAQYFAQQQYQCWGIEFRGQGTTLPAPPGNLVHLYLSDLFSVVDAWSLKGPLLDHLFPACTSSSSDIFTPDQEITSRRRCNSMPMLLACCLV